MVRKRRGLILVISAPAGAGKTTLCKRLLQTLPSLVNLVSLTTRSPRRKEIEGIDYYFISRPEFTKLVGEDFFAEWAEVHGELYGTASGSLERTLEEGKDILLEVDVKGGQEIKRKCPQATLVFVLPRSWPELEERLRNRATENEESIERRLATARKELGRLPYYDYFLINDKVDRALKDLLRIIKLERNRIRQGDGACW